MLHDIPDFLRREAIARRIIGRSQQQHTRTDTTGVFNDFIYIVGEGVVLLVQGIHLERAVALAGHAVVVPPRVFGNQNFLVVALDFVFSRRVAAMRASFTTLAAPFLHQVVVDGIFENVFATIGQKHLLLGHAINFAQAHGYNALLALIVDARIETQRLGVEIADGLDHLFAGFKVEFVSIKKIHCFVHKRD